jgi:CRP-like cAMP-binding protein
VERLLLLRRAPWIGTLPAQELALIGDQARPRAFARGEVLLREGEAIGSLYLVVEGRVRLRRGGREVGQAGPGSGVGGLGLLARDEQGIEAVAESDTLTLELDGDAIFEILEDRSPVLRHLLREISKEVLDLWHRAPRETVAALPRAAAPGFDSPLDFVERMLFLRQALPFLRSSASALADLARGLVELSFEPGVVLWRRGEASRQVFLLVRGAVTCSSALQETGLDPGPGDTIGGLEAIAGMPRWYDAVCDSPVVVLSGDVEMLFDVFEDNTEVALGYLTFIARWHLRALELIVKNDHRPLLPFFGSAETP